MLIVRVTYIHHVIGRQMTSPVGEYLHNDPTVYWSFAIYVKHGRHSEEKNVTTETGGVMGKSPVKESRYMPGVAQRVPGS